MGDESFEYFKLPKVNENRNRVDNSAVKSNYSLHAKLNVSH